jgi:coenzyme F420-reducing hydrogenase delta subunit
MGDCHYLDGNYMTAKRIAVMKQLLAFIGIEEERLRLEYAYALNGFPLQRAPSLRRALRNLQIKSKPWDPQG